MIKKYLSTSIIAGLALFTVSCGSEKAADATKKDATKAATEVKKQTPQVKPKAVEATGNAKFEFENTVWNFGDITQGESVSHVFKFKNTGTEPLIISNAKGSCGCTVPTYTRTPIAPGESGELNVTFNSRGKLNKQMKTVTITANTTPNITRLRVEGNIAAAKPAAKK
ncbi:MAG: DUF1573 domain-containing protein [Flavobacteriales bacterium]|jgi:hypothetical protein|nr:DUF1573 domain-containing protein [Flavobacteriales bacterium]